MPILAGYAVCHPPLIIPTVGRGAEREIQATINAYREVARRICEHAPQTIVVTSPHAPLYRDAFHVSTAPQLHGSMEQFRAPQTQVDAYTDAELAQKTLEFAEQAGLPMAPSSRDAQLDHATFIPLWFAQRAYEEAGRRFDCEVLRIGLSWLAPSSHKTLGKAIYRAVEQTDRRVVFVASGDLSHKLKDDGPYGFAPEGPKLDAELCRIFEDGDLNALFDLDEGFCEKAAECGVRSFQIMAGALQGLEHDSELLSYEGPFGVGYATAAYEVKERDAGQAGQAGQAGEAGGGASAAEQSAAGADRRGAAWAEAQDSELESALEADPYVALARMSVEGFVRTGEPISRPNDLPQELLKRRAGAFVSLHEHGELRGCIGTIAATANCLADEVIRNAVSAAAHDPRFDPVREDELDFLEISVDVLGDAEAVASLDQLDPKRYGVIVTKGYRRGLLLPDLDGVDTVEMQLSIAKAKAGIRPDEDGVEVERFEVVRHSRGGEPRHG